MDPIQFALVVLIVIQSIILVIIAIALVVIFVSIKKGIDRVNHILSTVEDVADGVKKAANAGLANVVGNAINNIINKKRSR